MNKFLIICLAALACFVASAIFGAQTPLQLLQRARNDTVGWSKQNTRDGEFKSVVSLHAGGTTPAGDQWTENQMYAVVERTIDGNDHTFIEQFTPVNWGDDDDYCWFVDAGPAAGAGSTGGQIPEVLGDYPTLRTTSNQADLGLTETTLVSNLTDLQNMSNDLAGNYYMTANIDASASAFTPIGTSATPFTGTFDGNGNSITDLNMARGGSDFNALFGYIEGTARIANITVSGVSISGDDYCAALVGKANATATNAPIIQNCHSSGTIIASSVGTVHVWFGGIIGNATGDAGSGNQVFIYDCSSSCTIDGSDRQTRDFGGLIGEAISGVTISNSFATGTVTAGTILSGTRHGGFIGRANNTTTISFCHATGDVTCEIGAGGFAGAIETPVTVDKCYATGNVTGTNQEIGGFVGDNNGDIEDCYSWGNASGTGGSSAVIGGFVGRGTVATDTYKQIYSIGAATGDSFVGGFAGSGNGVGTDVYWDTEASGNATSDGDLEEVGQTTTWLKTNPNYPSTWDFDTIWYQEYTPAYNVDANEFIVGNPLIGETVCVYADGNSIGNYIVDANGVTDLGASYDVVIAGINYWSKLETVPLNAGPRLADKKLSAIRFDLDRAYYLEYAMGANSIPIVCDFNEVITSSIKYERVSFPFGSMQMPTVYIQTDKPVPLGIRAIIPEMTWYSPW